LPGLPNLSDVYTHRSQGNTTITLTKRLYYIGGSHQTHHGDCGSSFDYKPLIQTDTVIQTVIDNFNMVYFYYPPEFGWLHKGYYYLKKTPITILSGKKLNSEWSNINWNKNGDWMSQTCQFEVSEEKTNATDSLKSANQYDRFLVLLEKIK
jgi:hypothetical protein